MNKIILMLVIITIMSCCETKQSEKISEYKNNFKVEHIMGPVENGLTKVILDDTNTILIYRNYETCSMIEIK